jgi:hypothetical protein
VEPREQRENTNGGRSATWVVFFLAVELVMVCVVAA